MRRNEITEPECEYEAAAWRRHSARIKQARAMLERARAGDATPLATELGAVLEAFYIHGPFVADPTRPGRINAGTGLSAAPGLSIDVDDDWFFDPATEAAVVAEILAEILNRALGIATAEPTRTGDA